MVFTRLFLLLLPLVFAIHDRARSKESNVWVSYNGQLEKSQDISVYCHKNLTSGAPFKYLNTYSQFQVQGLTYVAQWDHIGTGDPDPDCMHCLEVTYKGTKVYVTALANAGLGVGLSTAAWDCLYGSHSSTTSTYMDVVDTGIGMCNRGCVAAQPTMNFGPPPPPPANPSTTSTTSSANNPSTSPNPSPAPTAPSGPAPPPGCSMMYPVQSGETCASIASQFGVSLTTLQQANGGLCDHLTAGTSLCIPSSATGGGGGSGGGGSGGGAAPPPPPPGVLDPGTSGTTQQQTQQKPGSKMPGMPLTAGENATQGGGNTGADVHPQVLVLALCLLFSLIYLTNP